jgi:TolA-binding protein
MEDVLKSALIPMLALFTLNSCSWYKDLERSLVKDDEKKMRSSRNVPREQYDNLLVKYEELSKKYEQLKEGPNKGQPSLVDELQKSSSENFSQNSQKVSETPATQVETVDAFPNQVVVAADEVPSDIESQLNLYRRGVSLKDSNTGEATKIFQQLETAGVPAVKVRSKFQIGEILYGKGQFDLALQVFEDIINKYDHSGVVLDALKYAEICSDKLGIQNKKDQYASMLHDVFEAK